MGERDGWIVQGEVPAAGQLPPAAATGARLPFADDMPLQDLKHLFDWCQENSFALPAVNCISTSSIDAVLEATFRPLPTANLTLAGAYSTRS